MVSGRDAAQNGESRTARRIRELCAVDEQVRKALPITAVTEALSRPGIRPAEIVAAVMEGYADRPALAQRARERTVDEATGRPAVRLLPSFETIGYRELWARARAVAAAWYHDPDRPLRAGGAVAVLGFTGIDYTVLDLACTCLGTFCVPLQTTTPLSQLLSILREAGPHTVAVDAAHLGTAVGCVLGGASPARLVVFDHDPEDGAQRSAFASAHRQLTGTGVVLDTLDAVRERGRTAPSAPMHTSGTDDTLAMLIYTSGSTGTPKGAVYTEKMSAGFWQPFGHEADVPAITVNFMPMSHLAGRAGLFQTLARGGTACFTARGDQSTLLDDIALARPTCLIAIPRLFDMLHQRFQSEVARRARTGAARDRAEREVKDELRNTFLGGRILSITCGAAPLTEEMKTFVESVADVEVHDVYGATETGGVVTDNHRVLRPPVIDYRLADVPGLGYFATDRPYPRGELLIRTENLFPGYFKRPELAAEFFDEDGYYRTGDVMAETGPDLLAYVGRRNDVLKLSQGEFVTVSRLEAVYADSPLVRQIYVYGNSARPYLLAVVVPTEEAVHDHDAEALKPLLLESLQQTAQTARLQPYEIPRDILVETEPFTADNGLLSGIGKLLPPKLKDRYGAQLEQLYSDLARHQADELRSLRGTAGGRPVAETVGRAAQAVLQSGPADAGADVRFGDLGGDSLAAVSYADLLQEIFDVEVPVGMILSPANSLQRLADYIEEQRRPGRRRPAFASVHGRGSTGLRAADLALGTFIDAGTLSAAGALPPPAGTPETVLVTGANGFLGRFLCLEWMERLDPVDGTVICLVRGSDATAARRRLAEAFDSGDAELTERFRDLAARRLDVVAGDVGLPDLGLDGAAWSRLAASTDLIVHAAAHVNHVLAYDKLFDANVVGTAGMIRLAMTDRLKPLVFLSTPAVAAQIDPADFEEDGDIRVMSPVRVIDDSYANGYGNSKWAGEVLLREAHDGCGLPVTVFRGTMMLAHSRYRGQLNLPDAFTRWLISVIATGLAPRSFYRTGEHGRRPRAHYDGLPVDFISEAVTALCARPWTGFRSFDLLNPHDDDVSLDRFTDWLTEAGLPIERIDDYDDWFTRFGIANRALPEEQRGHSVLPLLHSYREPQEPLRGPILPADGFRTAIGDIPHVSRSLIDKYVADLRHLGVLAAQ